MHVLLSRCRLLGKWPNTYAYTKAVAEHVIREEAGNLPVGMFRPAIGKPSAFFSVYMYVCKRNFVVE